MQNANSQIGQAIRKARIKAGLSQAKLGELIGKADNTICDYEKGKNDLPVSVFFEIVAALDMDIKKLMPKRKGA